MMFSFGGFNVSIARAFSGTNCEIDLAVCNSTGEIQCKNGGECVEGPGVSFSCNCTPGNRGLELAQLRSSVLNLSFSPRVTIYII